MLLFENLPLYFLPTAIYVFTDSTEVLIFSVSFHSHLSLPLLSVPLF